MDQIKGSNASEPQSDLTELIIRRVNENIDDFTKRILQKQINDIEYELKHNPLNVEEIVKYPAPHKSDPKKTVDLNINSTLHSTSPAERYEILQVDEFYGDTRLNLNPTDSKFEEQKNSISWNSLNQEIPIVFKTSGNNHIFDVWFDETIAYPLTFKMNDNSNNDKPNVTPAGAYKPFHSWRGVDINNLGNNSNDIFGDMSDNAANDLWITLIAFTSYGAHRTIPIKAENDENGLFFKNDVTFLSEYKVRPEFEKYGACAYFDQRYKVKQIYLSHTDSIYKPSQTEWEHAKWVWKVSVSVATFLVDWMSHCR
eukprot:106692_1